MFACKFFHNSHILTGYIHKLIELIIGQIQPMRVKDSFLFVNKDMI